MFDRQHEWLVVAKCGQSAIVVKICNIMFDRIWWFETRFLSCQIFGFLKILSDLRKKFSPHFPVVLELLVFNFASFESVGCKSR